MKDVIAQSAVPVNVTGNTLLNPVAAALIPAGILGLDGQLIINIAYSHNSSADDKTITATLGGTNIFTDVETTASTTQSVTIRVRNRHAYNSQLISGAPSSEFQPAAFAGTVNSTAAIDTTRDQVLRFFIQLENGADNMSLDSYSVEYARAGP
jgi:hypothetical protein